MLIGKWEHSLLQVESFGNCLLEHEEVNMYSKIIEIEEKLKLGNYLRLVYAYAFSSQVFERIGDFEKAMSYGLKALEISEKTDSLAVHGIVDSNLTVIYTKLGDIETCRRNTSRNSISYRQIFFHIH